MTTNYLTIISAALYVTTVVPGLKWKKVQRDAREVRHGKEKCMPALMYAYNSAINIILYNIITHAVGIYCGHISVCI